MVIQYYITFKFAIFSSCHNGTAHWRDAPCHGSITLKCRHGVSFETRFKDKHCIVHITMRHEKQLFHEFTLKHAELYLQNLSSGIGYATQVVIAYAAVSYIVIQAWAFFYLFSSFSAEVPWASCRNSWNTGRTNKVECKYYVNIYQKYSVCNTTDRSWAYIIVQKF